MKRKRRTTRRQLALFAHRVRYLREQGGLTRAQVAKRVGVAVGSVGVWERGEGGPNLGTLIRLRAVLGCSWHELLGGMK